MPELADHPDTKAGLGSFAHRKAFDANIVVEADFRAGKGDPQSTGKVAVLTVFTKIKGRIALAGEIFDRGTLEPPGCPKDILFFNGFALRRKQCVARCRKRFFDRKQGMLETIEYTIKLLSVAFDAETNSEQCQGLT